MTTKKTAASLIAALALSASIAGPALAGAPVFEGPVTCISYGEPEDMGIRTFTKKDMSAYKRFWVGADFCDKGSVDFSAMVQVTTS